MAIISVGEIVLANLFSKKIKGEENRSQLQPVTFSSQNKPIASLKKSQIDGFDELESYKKLRKARKKKAVYRMLVWLLVVLFLPIIVFFAVTIANPNSLHNFFGYTFYIVSSHSMEPEFMVGDCVIVEAVASADDIKVGSDITFVSKKDGRTITHRVIGIVEKNGSVEYVTKGINVSTADTFTVPFANVIGVRIATAKVLGQAITFFRTPVGIVVFVGIIAAFAFGFYMSFKMSNDIRSLNNV